LQGWLRLLLNNWRNLKKKEADTVDTPGGCSHRLRREKETKGEKIVLHAYIPEKNKILLIKHITMTVFHVQFSPYHFTV
jgi:hypothetical protein